MTNLMRMSASLGTAVLDTETDTEGARVLAGADAGRVGLDCSRPVREAAVGDCWRAGDLLVVWPLLLAGDVRADEGRGWRGRAGDRDRGLAGEGGEEEEARRGVAMKRGEGGAV